MPTIMTHAVAASAMAVAVTGGRRQPRLFWVLCASLAVLPDVDVVSVALPVSRGSLWAHRGLTHSLPVAALTAAAVALAVRHRLPLRPMTLWFCLVLAMGSHGLLDTLTNGGNAVALWAPFSSARHVAPWRPLVVSPIGLHFFSASGMRALTSEVAWVWIPAVLLAMLVLARRARVRSRGRAARPRHRPPGARA